MNIYEWAIKHRVSGEALSELQTILYQIDQSTAPVRTKNLVDKSENENESIVRVAASKLGWRLFRNNRGATKTDTGSFVRFGLANESDAMNKTIKSSDWIGIRPVIITGDMVNSVIGQFVSIEVKSDKWNYSINNKDVVAQKRWLDLIVALGGYAKFSKGDL